MLARWGKFLGLSLAALGLLAGLAYLLMPGIHLSSLGMILNVSLGQGVDIPEEKRLKRLHTQDGFSLSIFAQGIENPRMMRRTQTGQVLVSSPRTGKIFQLTDSDGDGFSDRQMVLMDGLTRPHGLEIHDGYLYVAESNQIGRIHYDSNKGKLTGTYEIVVPDLSDNGNHWSKTIRFDGQGWLYVAMGSSCNVCNEADPRRATIMKYRADGSDAEIFATGLRNSVGMDFAPWSGALYATDNGRDLLGDDYPACELNRIQQGAFYGWPQLNGNNDLDPDFGEGQEALQKTATPPSYAFNAHNAPLGIHFSSQLPRTALVALHGSWNRSQPDGFKVVTLNWDHQDQITASDFVWGFEQEGDVVGRPVDIISDGVRGYFLSDDYAGVIYRISPKSYQSPQASRSKSDDQPITQYEQVAVEIDSELALAGERLYQNLPCSECHSEAAPTPIQLEKLHERYSLLSLAAYFLAPTPPMPLYNLNLAQREQLAHFLLSQD